MISNADYVHHDITPGSLPNERFRVALRFWLNAKGDEDLPPQSAIDPVKLPRDLLANFSVMSVENGPRRFRIRLPGTKIVEATGENATGRLTADIPGAEPMTERLQMCVETRQPYYSEGRLTWSKNDFRSFAALILPFAGPNGDVSRILTYTEFS